MRLLSLYSRSSNFMLRFAIWASGEFLFGWVGGGDSTAKAGVGFIDCCGFVGVEEDAEEASVSRKLKGFVEEAGAVLGGVDCCDKSTKPSSCC